MSETLVEILDKALQIHVWMLKQGHQDWRLGHICSRNCAERLERELAAAIKERDQLRSFFTKLGKPKYTGDPIIDADLLKENPDFKAWVYSLPLTYWTKYDLSAARIGWEAAVRHKATHHETNHN